MPLKGVLSTGATFIASWSYSIKHSLAVDPADALTYDRPAAFKYISFMFTWPTSFCVHGIIEKPEPVKAFQSASCIGSCCVPCKSNILLVAFACPNTDTATAIIHDPGGSADKSKERNDLRI